MLPILAPLRELTIVSIVFRFLLATACGAVIGYERGKKRHAAGLGPTSSSVSARRR